MNNSWVPSRVSWSSLPALLVCAGFAVQAEAHHAITMHFNPNQPIEIRGTVVDFKLRSPHSSFVIEGIATIDGVAQSTMPERWEVEANSVPGMRNAGIDRDTFAPGDQIVIRGLANREEGFRFAFGARFVAADGTTYPADAGEAPAAAVALDSDAVGIERLSGRWRSPGYINGDDTPLPLNQAGRQAWLNYDPKLSPAATCVTQNVPGVFSAPYLFDLRVREDRVVLHNEAYNVRREVIFGDDFLSSNPGGDFGVARAEDGGDMLVVESRDFPRSGWGLGVATHVNGGGADVPSSARKTVIERYSVSDDGQTLTLAYTLSDPEYLTEPYEGVFTLMRVSDEQPMYEYVCDPESAAMFARDADDPLLEVGER